MCVKSGHLTLAFVARCTAKCEQALYQLQAYVQVPPPFPPAQHSLTNFPTGYGLYHTQATPLTCSRMRIIKGFCLGLHQLPYTNRMHYD